MRKCNVMMDRVFLLLIAYMSFDLKLSVQQESQNLSPQQKKLNRLIEQIEQQKLDLAMWQNRQHDIQSYMHQKLLPIYAELHGTLFSQLEQLWMHLQQQNFSKADLEQLDVKLQSLAKTLKKSQSINTEKINLVDEIYNFYQQDRTYSQSKKHSKQQKKQSKPSSQNSNHFEQDECESVDLEIEYTEFEDWNTEKYEQQREEHQRKRLAQKHEQAEKLAEQSLKTVYLKITAMIHPDREPDESKKVEKTALLQRANEAYEQQDLYFLLKLQLEVEQSKNGSNKGLSAEQVKFYQHALEAQSQALKKQIQELIDSLVWSNKAIIAVKKSKEQLNITDLYKQIDADVSIVKQQLKAEKQRLVYLGKESGLEMLLEHGIL